ncbi:Hypothetical protein NTJ_13222 [Nesidiocoris tenuis]|uniref:MARVEL domain-containing protein n=1 Tax=Nesidiocoris tenuis TaxID=355587 RepID=A0ABN7B7Q8_9HEMI|nr:Hypothetical protein NTJ_13222 [Nesidiocoris tenuis]
MLASEGFPETECINYIDSNAESAAKSREERRKDWQPKNGKHQTICFSLLQEKEQQKRLWMQNLSISCALVCLIILGSSALLGAFGVLKNQISAVLVTGVMYLLAATFALFTLVIIHYKWRSTECPGPGADGMIAVFGSRQTVQWAANYLAPARISSGSWSRALGWTALSLCVLTSLFWILLSIVMRVSPRIIA